MGFKGIVFSILALCISTIASANSLTTTYERVRVGAFTGTSKVGRWTGGSCKEATLAAMEECGQWAKIAKKELNGGVSWCRRLSCECATDGIASKAVCLGTLTYEQKLTVVRNADGKLVGTRRGPWVEKNPVFSADGRGFTCAEAKVEATSELYAQLAEMSEQYDATGVMTRSCSCENGGFSGVLATCKSGLYAHYLAPVESK